MNLTNEEKAMLAGEQGTAVKKSMEILTALGDIFSARRLIKVKSVQIAGVSYHNLGDAGLEFLSEMAIDGKAKVYTTLNPAGMDMENWKDLGIDEDFAEKQIEVIETFSQMGVITTCTCTPYFVGNKPQFGDHISWSESSAVCYANSVLGAKTNREGGPSALASALTGRTPEYGMHLENNRNAQVFIDLLSPLSDVIDFGALGYVIGKKIGKKIPYIKGIRQVSIEQLKSFAASLATYGGTAMFHIEDFTPNKTTFPENRMIIKKNELMSAIEEMTETDEIDFVSIGCPHCSIEEIERISELLNGKKVQKEFWICLARPVKKSADKKGYTEIITEAGAKLVCDTCLAVAPLKGRFKSIATNSAKGVYYGRGKNAFKTKFCTLEECVETALGD